MFYIFFWYFCSIIDVSCIFVITGTTQGSLLLGNKSRIMVGMRSFLLALSLFVLSDATLINEEVSREIDLKSHLVKITTTITLKNGGDSAVSSFQFAVDPSHASELAHISASSVSSDNVVMFPWTLNM